jgi:hypothetical protein
MRARVRVKVGQGVLFLNRKRDKARIVDGQQCVHNYYAPEGEVYDLALIQRQVGAMRLTVSVDAKAQAKIANSKKKSRGVLRAA